MGGEVGSFSQENQGAKKFMNKMKCEKFLGPETLVFIKVAFIWVYWLADFRTKRMLHECRKTFYFYIHNDNIDVLALLYN